MMHVDLEYRGGYSIPWWDILSTVGDTQYRGDIMMHVGDIVSTVGETIFRDLSTATVLNTSTVFMISPTCILISPTVLKFQKMI